MNNLPEEFNIDANIKQGFDLVVELDDEVEYLIDKEAIASIRNNESTIALKRLIDSEVKIITTERVIKTLQTGGPVDYLKIK